MHLPAAQAAFARPGLVSRVDVVFERDADAARVAAAINARLPPGLSATAPVEQALGVRRVIRSLQAFLWAGPALSIAQGFSGGLHGLWVTIGAGKGLVGASTAWYARAIVGLQF